MIEQKDVTIQHCTEAGSLALETAMTVPPSLINSMLLAVGQAAAGEIELQAFQSQTLQARDLYRSVPQEQAHTPFRSEP